MSHQFIDGVFFDPRTPPESGRLACPGIFLDRDGCIIEIGDYLHRPEDVRLVDGAAAAIAEWNRRGVPVVIVTNQSGIGRGYYGWDEFVATQAEVDRLLSEGGARVNAVVACPFHADAKPPYRHPDHPARKPNPGMLQLAAGWLKIDLRQSWIVGDSLSDMKLVETAGLAGGVHVMTGYGKRDRANIAAELSTAAMVKFAEGWPDVAQMSLPG